MGYILAVTAATKADLLANANWDENQLIALSGDNTQADKALRFYMWFPNSSATDDGENVIKPTETVGNGRLLKIAAPVLLTTTGTSGAASFDPVTNTLNIPNYAGSKRVESYSGTTNASGSYSVTFASAFPVAPNVQANIVNQSSTNQFIRISNVTTTGFTVNVFQRNAVTLLGIEVLLAATTNVSGAAVDVLITQK